MSPLVDSCLSQEQLDQGGISYKFRTVIIIYYSKTAIVQLSSYFNHTPHIHTMIDEETVESERQS